MSRLQFITAIPLNVRQGSGCYVATSTLASTLMQMGVEIEMIAPRIHLPVYALERVIFNRGLRNRKFICDATIGIDADGYARPRRPPPHVACIKGVLADAVRFESGLTRASLAFQARLEAENAKRADLVITISKYCADRIEEFYGVSGAVVVPELIDLQLWRWQFSANPVIPDPSRFTIFTVCRFYPRKRVDVLLRAAAQLRDRIPGLELRIAGGGLESARLHQLALDLKLGDTVKWLGDVKLAELAAEYNRADVFCLPSEQEGFGIVFLEAMAAGKAIVASRAAAVPEVVRHGVLVEPGSAEALAEGIERLYRDPDLRLALGEAGRRAVQQFDSGVVAAQFLAEVARIAPGLRMPVDLPKV